jgi:predicted SAM-dependent methyltransferase
MNRLNIGCGLDIRSGYINMDCSDLSGVDVVHDISNLPLPFKDDSFDEIVCKDILEHVDYIKILRDIHRILKPDCNLYIRVPHFTSKDAYSDPTHIKVFTVNTFTYFTLQHMRSYYFDFHFSNTVSQKIYFDKRPAYFWNYFLEHLVNYNQSTMNFYEGTFLRIFPATNLEVILKK